jgi:hypothetical protein
VAHDYHAELKGVVGEDLWVPLPLGAATGAVVGDLVDLQVASNGARVADPATDLGLVMSEVDSVNQAGLYFFRLQPVEAGTLFIRFTYATLEYEFTIGVADPDFSDAGLEGDYTVTIDDGTDPVQGASVTLYDAAGTKLIQRGTTDAAGQVTFYGLPIGNYQVRAFKEGVDFSAINPTTITVVASDGAAPIIDEAFPGTISIGDHLVILGRLFDPADTQVLFGSEATVAPVEVNAAGTAILVEVPAGLTNTIIALRVAKASGTLLSNIFTVVRT